MTRISAIAVQQEPEHYLLTVRATIDFMTEFEQFAASAFARTGALMQERNLFPMRGPIVRFHNTELAELDVEAGWRICAPTDGDGDISCVHTPSQKVAAAIDLGPYQEQDPTMMELMAWVEQNQFAVQGPILYCYLNDTDRPAAEFLTEMSVPVS